LRAAEVDKLIPTHMDVPTNQPPEIFIDGGACDWKKLQWLHRLVDVGFDYDHVSVGFSYQADRRV
jgi:hypothetical protein